VLNTRNKLQIMPAKNKIFLWKRKTTAFWQKNTTKTRHFGKNHSIHGIWWKSRSAWFPCFCDYLLSLHILYEQKKVTNNSFDCCSSGKFFLKLLQVGLHLRNCPSSTFYRSHQMSIPLHSQKYLYQYQSINF